MTRQGSRNRRDVIVVGGGINGLTCAATLARRGCRVLLFEAAEAFGGAARPVEFAPGYRAPLAAHLLPPPDAPLLRELRLAEHGWSKAQTPTRSVALSLDGAPLDLDSPANVDSGGGRNVVADTAALSRMLRTQLLAPPLPLGIAGWRDGWRLGRAGLRLARFGPARVREFLRVIGLAMADYVAEYDIEPLLAGALCADAVWGTGYGPSAPGTVLSYLHRQATLGDARHWLQPPGGPAALIAALVASARASGAELNAGVGVTRILVEYGKATGVELADGRVIRALTVISAVDPATTLLQLVGAPLLETGLVREARHIRGRGAAGRVLLALDAWPAWQGLAPDRPIRALVAPSPTAVEQAADSIKYGEVSPRPILEVTAPTLADASLAPSGQHVLSVTAQFAPLAADATSAAAIRQALLEAVLATLSGYAPDIRERVVAAACYGPAELAAMLGSQGGHWHHADIALDQFFFTRPCAAAATYRLPVDGLYLASAGTHPGGGLTGWAGVLAAREVLAR
ncbi:MAG: NAD(P)/FAD-dependent oxidoreductase [Pseudomonadota bacterium]